MVPALGQLPGHMMTWLHRWSNLHSGAALSCQLLMLAQNIMNLHLRISLKVHHVQEQAVRTSTALTLGLNCHVAQAIAISHLRFRWCQVVQHMVQCAHQSYRTHQQPPLAAKLRIAMMPTQLRLWCPTCSRKPSATLGCSLQWCRVVPPTLTAARKGNTSGFASALPAQARQRWQQRCS